MTFAPIRNAVVAAVAIAVIVGCSDDEMVEEPLDTAAAEESQTPSEASASEQATAAEASSELGSGTDTLPVDVPVDPAQAALEGAVNDALAAGGTSAPVASEPGSYAYIMPDKASRFMWVFTDGLNVRAAPSPTAAKLGKLRWGKKVGVLAEEGDWVKIGDNAWASRQHLTDRVSRWFSKGSSGKVAKRPASKASQPADAVYYRVSAQTLNVRDQPGKQGKIVGLLTFGSLVQGRKAADGWIEILPGQFVSGAWLSAGKGPVAH